MSMKFEYDLTKFRLSLNKNVPSHNLVVTRKKLFKVGARMAHDIVEEAPTPPIEFGNLRGSENIVIANRVVQENPTEQEINSEGKVDPPPLEISGMSDLEVRVYMSMPYAERQHELLAPEGPFQPGPLSVRAGNVGGGFMRKKAERADLIENLNELFMEDAS